MSKIKRDELFKYVVDQEFLSAATIDKIMQRIDQREAEIQEQYGELVEAAVLYVGDGGGARAIDNSDWIRFRDAVRVFTKLSQADRLEIIASQMVEEREVKRRAKIYEIAAELREERK